MAVKSIETLDHTVDRALDITKVGFDGLFHLTSMGTDSIIDARVDRALVAYKSREDTIANCGLDVTIARDIDARIRAQ